MRAFRTTKKRKIKTPQMKLRYKSVGEHNFAVKNPTLYKTIEGLEGNRAVKRFRKGIKRTYAKYERYLKSNPEAAEIVRRDGVSQNFWEAIKNPKHFENDENFKSLIGYNLPWIYVFVMDIIDGYVKIGYTFAKTPNERVDEWKKIYKNAKLHLIAKFPASFVCDGIRLCIDDTDVHKFVEEAQFLRGDRAIFEGKGHYCEEFFKNTNVNGTCELFNFDLSDNESWEKLFSYDNFNDHVKIDIFQDIMDKIYDILKDANRTFSQKKTELPHLKNYGDLITSKGEEAKILRWSLTNEQIEVIEKGINSLGKCNTELLLAAIMRFGKSAVSYRIMLGHFKPTKEMGAKHLIVSGKDTRETWQKDFFHQDIIERTQEQYDKGAVFMWYEDKTLHWCGNIKYGNAYHEVYYLSGKETKPNTEITTEIFDEICQNNVVFLYVSFQDVYGEKEEGKTTYQIKKKHTILFNTEFNSIIVDETHFGARSRVFGAVLNGEDESITVDEGDVRPIKCKAHLHLSATPYKILASNEFNREKHEVIGVVTLSDIYYFTEKWNEDHPGKKEWENPYFGTPQLHTLLLNLPSDVLDGEKTFKELFSTRKNKSGRAVLVHKKEVVAMFSYFFGSFKHGNDGILRNSITTTNGVMKHLVMVLPSIDACDAICDLFKDGEIEYGNEYVPYKLSSSNITERIDGENELNKALWENERVEHKTITFTCDRFTTGSTINLWDTMLYFKEGDSAETYDQVWGRLLSRAVVDVFEDEGQKQKVGQVCLKKHVYFIDFKPNRAIEVRYNYTTQMRDYFLSLNTEDGKERAERVQSGVRNYFMCRVDDFVEIKDFDSLTREWEKTFETDSHGRNYQANNLCNTFMALDLLKKCGIPLFGINQEVGTTIRVKRGEGAENGNPTIEEYPNEEIFEPDVPNGGEMSGSKKPKTDKKERATMMEIINGVSNLSIACTKRVTNSEELLSAITGENIEAYSSLEHFSDICKFLKASCEPEGHFTISAKTSLNNFINEKNSTVNDEIRYPNDLERAIRFRSSIRNISDNEYITPDNTIPLVCDKLIYGEIYNGGTIIDAWSYGEFIPYLYEKLGKDFVIENVFALPSSKGARIFVEKLFDILKLDKKHILNDNDIKKYNMHFEGLVGNPPYQGDSSKQLYPGFYKLAKEIADNVCLIFPMEWQNPNNQPAKGLGYMYQEEVRCDEHIINIENLSNVFKGVQGAKDVNIITWSKHHQNGLSGNQLVKPINGTEYKVTNLKNCFDTTTDKPEELKELASIVSKSVGFKSVSNSISAQKPYGMETNVLKKFPQYFTNEQDDINQIKLYAGDPDKDRGSGYVERFMPYSADCLSVSNTAAPIESFKLLFPKQWGNMSKNWLGGTFGDILIARPNEVCTQKYQTAFPCDSPEDIKKASKYFMSRCLRALVLVKKNKKGAARGTFEFVPQQDFHEDFWNSDNIDDIDNGLFNKYNVPEHIRKFVMENIQPRSINNIINYKEMQ